jgi:hypothetical protein
MSQWLKVPLMFDTHTKLKLSCTGPVEPGKKNNPKSLGILMKTIVQIRQTDTETDKRRADISCGETHTKLPKNVTDAEAHKTHRHQLSQLVTHNTARKRHRRREAHRLLDSQTRQVDFFKTNMKCIEVKQDTRR